MVNDMDAVRLGCGVVFRPSPELQTPPVLATPSYRSPSPPQNSTFSMLLMEIVVLLFRDQTPQQLIDTFKDQVWVLNSARNSVESSPPCA